MSILYGIAAVSTVAAALCANSARTVSIKECTVVGNFRTKSDVLCELLPRQPPSMYSEDELEELKRRVANLGIFDAVDVDWVDEKVKIHVREKWTLIPSVDFATGQTIEDTYALLGVAEYNTLGRAIQTNLSLSHEKRGFNFELSILPHEYHPEGWNPGISLARQSVEMAFPDSEAFWQRTTTSAELIMIAPAKYHSHFKYQTSGWVWHDYVQDIENAVAPRTGWAVGTAFELGFDKFFWDDLSPHGYQCTLALFPGWLLSERPQPNYSGKSACKFAVSIASSSGVAFRATINGNSTGNPHFGEYLGSRQVRGIEDGIFWTALQMFTNIEARAAVRIASRWAIQGALFSDAASFIPMNASGEVLPMRSAVNLGVGFRLIPTFLAQLLLRIDGGMLFPNRTLFWQLALNQHF